MSVLKAGGQWKDKHDKDAELGLLQELAANKKTAQQVATDATRFRFQGRHLKLYVQDSNDA